MRSAFTTSLALLLLAAAAFMLAMVLSPFDEASVPQAGSVSGLLLGGLRESLAEKALVTADRYFHRGLDHHEAEAPPLAHTWFTRLGDRVSPRIVSHRDKDSVEEILPWLWFTTHLGSTNIEYVLTTAYWLQVSGHAAAAEKLLADTQRGMPPHPDLYLERARVALSLNRRDEARSLLTAGLACVQHAPHDSSPGMAHSVRDRLAIYRGYLHEADGETAAALSLYTELIAAHPQRTAGLRERAEALRLGRPVLPTAEDCIQRLCRATIRCPEHGHEETCNGDHDDDDDGHDHAHEHGGELDP